MKNYCSSNAIRSAVMIRPNRNWMRQAVLVLTSAFLILLSTARAEASQLVVPLVNFYEWNSLTGMLTVHYGYYNPNDFTMTEPIAPGKNFFTPPPPLRNQPTVFLPGIHRDVFAVTFVPFLEPAIKWTLQGQSVIAEQTLPACQPTDVELSMVNFRGAWDASATYYCSDVVSSGQGYWIAQSESTGETPVPGLSWKFIGDIWLQHVLGETARGPAGAPGPSGPQGPTGPEGPEGQPGQGLHVQGTWMNAMNYAANDVVSYDGSSWVAKRNNINVTPNGGYDWLLVARKGAAGQKGDIGPQGPAGTSNVFVSAQTYTIPRTGTLVIMDQHVNPNSFITLLYVGPCSNVLPPIASRIERGQFTVGGVPGKQFRYVVFN